MNVEPVYLPEFGLDVSWAMCRNTMCPNFGVHFTGRIPEGRKPASDGRYAVRLGSGSRGRSVAEIRCRHCGQSARLASNRAIRPIARYFLGLSLPFADCPNTQCENHGVNLYEHCPSPAQPDSPYRKTGEHTARCNRCGTEPGSRSIVLGTARRAANRSETRQRWRDILDGLQAARYTVDTAESLGISAATHHRHLARIGARLGDYNAFRNARLLHPDVPGRDRPVSVHTGILETRGRWGRWRGSSVSLPVLVSVVSVGSTAYVLAAHPCFLPAALCPDRYALEADGGRPALEAEWDALRHPYRDDPRTRFSTSLDGPFPGEDLDGYPIGLPYAALAHVLTVRKMLSGFRAVHHCLDATTVELLPAALVAWRDRIPPGRPEGTAEVVAMARRVDSPRRKPKRPERVPDASAPALDDAWRAAEKRFAEQPVPPRFGRGGLGRDDPRVRAALFGQAFKSAYAKTGGWAWLRHPPRTPGYRKLRTLWLTRTPQKTFEEHGRTPLANATLRPLDTVLSAIRASVPSAARTRRPEYRARGAARTNRPANRARGAAVRPSVLLSELTVYLFRRNHGLLTRPPPTVPAHAMGLSLAEGERPDSDDPVDLAWNFRLGVTQARWISRWRSQKGADDGK